MKYTVAALMVLFGAWAGYIGGSSLDYMSHRNDFQSGYNAGFAARDAQVQDTNSRLIAAGICRYADLACAGGKH